ncbi:3-hydroxyacyl-ACP dehydratase FabZ family protein [Lentilactobacillus farraginis]|uniref:(3R)-hydroxymyristoyl-[acyl carrier protein] dehydratase n=1 Tax=Lentilactobacillus farraginis DSM 18382 = JCM 14108 TaxID=1423743 RepID=X0PAJ6_9LACO|nr:3-hydroxyacyl-ACP dehydratase FabZ family protein [Lentilactobacillus farraginis]KRM09503.1 (3R)-hydroxymyristoyl-[acyl carrier protein] dehydratase [Lentilactobacillus farraginis DSM 18382 = JCM 14108]GAF36433.1 (3R)-hydroxymyristoyl-[acyl carrier protein] dehydratase [Lentilactobacillus farraginis DSM 18382 = JCM 14108]
MKPEVNDVIPQRYPFQMIDRFLEVTAGKTATAVKLISINEWFFANQQAGQLTVPRPIMIEAMAQTGVAAILTLPEYHGKNVFFGGIKNAQFQDDFRPGDQLTFKVEMKKLRANIGLGHGVITREAKVICEADLIFAVE